MAGMALQFNDKEYGALLQRTLPSVIRSEEDYDRHLQRLEEMMEHGPKSVAEGRLMELLGVILQDYEKRRFRLGESATPHSVLRSLMDAKKVRHKDVWHLFGSKGIASEVLNGKRAISKEAAKKLAKFFSVSVEVFL